MSDSQESMEVTLQTEVESGASGFSVAGGGTEGLFVKQVLKESPASKLFSLREGDQLLSATIFFDNIKYEDALKILQYSEPYKVQFNLKRKLARKEDLETMHFATQSKKEKTSQGKEALETSEKTFTEEDKADLIVKQRVGRPKRSKKDRLSWPKFQSLKGKKILGQRRSRSTSDAYEHAIPDISPTSTDTESQFQPEEIHAKVKRGSQKKLRFPSIGFKMHRTKQEPEERTKYEVKPLTDYENDTAQEIPELITVQYSTSRAKEKKLEEIQEPRKDAKETKFEPPYHTGKYPEVELTIKKTKEKKSKSKAITKKSETTVITTQITKPILQTGEIQDVQIKPLTPPKQRKKKQKGSTEKMYTKLQMDNEQTEKGKKDTDGIQGVINQNEEDSNVMIATTDIRMPTAKASLELKTPHIQLETPSTDMSLGAAEIKKEGMDTTFKMPKFQMPKFGTELKAPDLKVEAQSADIAVGGVEANLEGTDSKFTMPKLQMPKFGMSLPKEKLAGEGEITLPSVEVDISKPELKGEVTLPSVGIETDVKLPGAEMKVPSVELDVSEKAKIKTPDVKMPSVKVPKIKPPQVGVSLPKVEADISVPKAKVEVPEAEVSVKVPDAEGSMEGGGMKIHMPKFKMPSMGFSKPEIKGPKVDMDISAPKVDIALPDFSVTKPEIKAGDISADMKFTAPDVQFPKGEASLELKAPDLKVEAPSADVTLGRVEAKLEGTDSKFKMPKFQMPKFGMSLPKGKATAEGEITLPSVEVDVSKPELKGEVTLPSVGIETDVKLPGAEMKAPSVELEIAEKGKIKMPDVKMPSVKVPKMKTPQVGVSLPKVEADISLPKAKVEIPEAEVSVKVPDAEGSIDGGGLKIHMPKFKMPSMGFSKPEIKGPKVDMDISTPKVDIDLPDVSVTKPEIKAGVISADMKFTAPDIKIPKGEASLELKAPDLNVEAPSAGVTLGGVEAKLEGTDSKFKMPKLQMPKFGMSLPKGKAAAEGEITLPSMEVDVSKPELKSEVTLPSVGIETDVKLPRAEMKPPSVELEVAEMGKIKMPDVKMPSVKVPKMKTPQVGVSLPKVEADISVPKAKVEIPEAEVSVKVPDAEGSMEGGGMKIHMPKFKMPSMGFPKPEIKGPKVDMDISAPKVDIALPDVSVTKPEIKAGDISADMKFTAPDVQFPKGEASLELKAPDLKVETPSADFALGGVEAKLDGTDSKFKMPKLHMPKFGMSLPKGKAAAEGEITLPSMEVDVSKPELKGEVTLPSVGIETDVKLPRAEMKAPSVELEVAEKGKIKMPDVKMPSVTVPKMKTPQVGVSLPKVEADISVPKSKVEIPEAEVSVKVPDAEGSMEGGGMKIHMPKFKMPSMGFSKPEIKGPKVDMDISAPKVDIALPDVSVTNPEIKAGDISADISLSAPDMKFPKGETSLELKAPDLKVEAPSADFALGGVEAKLEGTDSKFKMPKFQMPKFGMSIPKGKATAEGEITLPSVEVDISKPELKGEVTLPSVGIETDEKLPGAEMKLPSVELEVSEKGKIKMPDVKMPSMKVPDLKTPQVGVSLPKVEADISVPKSKVEIPEAEVSVKVPDAEGSIKSGGMKMHMPKFKMPSMGFSKPEIKGPKVDMDISAPKVDIALPDVSVTKPEIKAGDISADISLSAPDVKFPKGEASLELKAPDLNVEAPSADVTLGGVEAKLEGTDSKFKMPKLQMPKFGMSLPKGKAAAEGELTLPSVEVDVSKPELKGEVTLPSVGFETDVKLPGAEMKAPSVELEVSEKGKIKMPSVKVPKIKTPQVGVSLPNIEGDISVPKAKVEIPEAEVSVKVPDAEGSIEGGGMKIHMPKFKMPSMGFSKPEIKGPKVDVDVSAPKVDIALPGVSVTKPEIKAGDISADMKFTAPDVQFPKGEASLELKAPDLKVEAPSADFALGGVEAKLDGTDSKFKMPKFHMPKFGMSLPKGKAVAEGEITLPSVEVDVSKPELKGEVTLPSVGIETDVKLPGAEMKAPSVELEVAEKGKIKMPDVKMPSMKVPDLKTPQVGVSLPKVEADISVPKAKVEIPEAEVSVKVPDAEGSIEGGGMKIHMPKFKMPSMGFSKPEIKGPKVDVDISAPKIDIALPDVSVTKPEIKAGDISADMKFTAPDVQFPKGEASLELKAPDLKVEVPPADIAVGGVEAKLDGTDSKFKMPKFHMPKFGMSLPKGKAVAEGEITLPSVEVDVSKPELKGDVTLPSVGIETDVKLPGAEMKAPSVELDVAEKGKIKMPDVKMPSVKVPKLKTPQVGVSLPKVEADISLPKAKVEVPVEEVSVKVPDAEGSIDGGGMKIHMPKFKMPSMGFSKPEIKGPKVDVDVSTPKVDIALPDVSVTKPEIKAGDISADMKFTGPDVQFPKGEASLELKAPDLKVEAPSADFALGGVEAKLDGTDSKFKMPKFQMPKFGMSLPKGKAVAEGEITLPSVEVDVSKPELKGEVTLPSVGIETDVKLPRAEMKAPSVELEVSEKGKIKMPDVKMPKMKTPQVGVSLPKAEADISVPKAKMEVPVAEVSVKVPEAEGSIEGGGMKIHMPKFKMPSMGFSKPEIKGPKVDVDISAPKIDIALPDVSVTKREIKAGDISADIKFTAPDVQFPKGEASLELKAPDVKVEAPLVDVDLGGVETKVEGMDSKFKRPKFQMPKFGISFPKGKASVDGMGTLPSVEVDVSIPEQKGEVILPSMSIETDLKLQGAEIRAPSAELEVSEKGKIKVPDVKMPSVKVPKMRTPQVGVSLPKVQADISLPPAAMENPEASASVNVPHAESSIKSGGMKMHMPKFKMPSMGFSKPEIKGPKVDVDVSAPKVDIALPDVSVTKHEIKAGDISADMKFTAPDIKIPKGEASLELKAPDLKLEAPSADIDVGGVEVKLEGTDSKFKMPKFQMPKFGMSLPTGKATAEGKITLPSVEVDISKPELKGEVTLPSVGIETDEKLPGAEMKVPSVELEVSEKGKIKMPDVKMPSMKVPDLKTPQVGVSLPKVEADISVPKSKVEIPEAEVSVKVPDAEGSIKSGGMKMHMPKFKMPSIGFSKPEIKGPKVDVDISAPKVDIDLPDVSVTKPEIKAGDISADISLSAPDVQFPKGEASLELKAPDLNVEAPSADVTLGGVEAKLEGTDSKFKMPKFQMPKFGMSLPKGKAAAEGELTLPSVEVDISKPELKGEVTLPSVGFETDVKLPGAEMKAPSVELEVAEKGKIKMPDVKMPSVKVPKMKTPQVGVSLPKVEADISVPKSKVEIPEAEVSVKVPDAEGSIEGGGMKIHMPKFKMPSMGFSKPEIKGPKVDVDVSAPKVDIALPDVSVTKPEMKAGDISADVKFSAPDVNIPKGETSLELRAADLQIEVPSAEITLDGAEAKMEGLDSKFKMPKLQAPKFGISLPKAKGADEEITFPSVDISVPKSDADIQGPDSEGKNIKRESYEKEIVEKESKFKMPKFKLPSFSWSPKKEASVSTDIYANLEDPSVPVPTGDIESELTLTVEEGEVHIEDLEGHISFDKDSEKTKIRRPHFSMPKISLPKMKSHKAEISVAQLHADMTVSTIEDEGKMSLQMRDTDISGSDSRKGIKMPEVKLPSLELSKPELKVPKMDMEISLPESDVKLSIPDASLSEAELKSLDVGDNVSKTMAEIKVPVVKGLEVGVEGPSTDISVDGTEIKTEGMDGKMKRPKFQRPKFGISFSKGKTPDTEISLPSEDAKVPQLKTTADIADIAVEAPTFEGEGDLAGSGKTGPEGKIKMPPIPRADMKIPAIDIKLPSVGLSVAQPETEAQDLVAAAKDAKFEGDIKTGSMDAEEKEGHFKMPKFKLPSFNWSPKKEASLKTTAKEPLEEPKLTILSDDTDAELTAVLSEDQEVHMELDAEIVTKKGQMKRPHFNMPKISLHRPKLPKSQGSLPKVEADITVERDGALVHIPDIESSFTTQKEEETEICIKMPKGTSKVEIKAPQVDTDIKVDIKEPTIDSSVELKSAEIGSEGEINVDSGSMKTDVAEGTIRMLKLQMPKFGISVPEGKLPETGVTLPEMETEVSHLQATKDFERLCGEAPTLEVKAEPADAEIKVSAGEIQMPGFDIEVSDISVLSPAEQDAKEQGEHEAKSGEIQTEESPGWFKMPKFRMPSFGRSSSKGKKGDAEGDGSTGKAPLAEVEIKAPEMATQSPHVVSELYSGQDILEGKVMFPQEDITKDGDSIQKEKDFRTGLLMGEGSFSQASGKADDTISPLGSKTYADVVKLGAEGQIVQIHKTSSTAPTSEISVPDVDIDMTVAETHATKITVAGTEEKVGAIITEANVAEQSPDAKAEKESQIKSPKKDIQGKESIFKMPKFSVPSFGWSTTKTTKKVDDATPDLQEPDVRPPEVRMDVSVTDEDFEIIEYPIEGFEKDMPVEGEVKAEGTDGSSKTKSSKFKMPKFGSLRTKSRSAEVDADPPKTEAEVSLDKTEGQIFGIQAQKAEEFVDMKSRKLDLAEKPGDTMGKQVFEDSEINFHIHKLKIPKFTYSTSVAEGQVLTSEDTTHMKCAATDTDGDGAPQQEFRTTFLDKKVEDIGCNIQKSTVRITTLSDIQRTQVETKLPSTDPSFEETTTLIQRPMEFNIKFPTEKIDTINGKIQKSVAKITTLTEPDIQTTQLECKLPSTESFIQSSSLHIEGPYFEGNEKKLQGKSAFDSCDSESQESFSTQIVRESEIPPSEVQTATYGFSLLKVKIQESLVNLDMPVKLSSTEYTNEMFESKDHQPSGEKARETTQKTSFAELKVSDKGQELIEEASSTTKQTKLKAFAVEVQSSEEFADSSMMSESAVEITEETEVASGEEESTTDPNEKSDSRRSSGRFKFWLPSLGFSSSVDDTGADSKPEVQKPFQKETQVDVPSTSDSDTAKQTEKAGWFRFPKLGFSSPTKKGRETDKVEETDPKEEKPQDEESPTEKSETFFDAQESLPPNETIAESETSETTPIVSSSARTELILLEKGKAPPQSVPEEA
ncbi:protein AHNAK2-like isoform X11 [Podarcis raffonei]|uniref:protein AHNAK2-like isoform X11 n=1 Tax=Podarcis raffonei TaxID=65483 RepID=UPI0023297A9E|nr:protein AHNAK2-like isoform X11 [Podarcis raffonei]